ncbi:MAG: hypothetical protein PHG65_00825 [Kiritimatiellae bacterium]|nr:hypothetical protein [Kiritimatiellia bacterium]
MNRFIYSGTACLLAAVLFLTLPFPSARAEDDSNVNKGALIGLFVVVVGVLFWLGFKSDMDDYTYAALEELPRYPGEDAEGGSALIEEGACPVLVLGSSPVAVNAEGIGFVF